MEALFTFLTAALIALAAILQICVCVVFLGGFRNELRDLVREMLGERLTRHIDRHINRHSDGA